MSEKNDMPYCVRNFGIIALIILILAIFFLNYVIKPNFAQSRDFDISVSSLDSNISPGNLTQTAVFVKEINGYDRGVSLTATGVPPDMEITFQPQYGIPTFASIMEIKTNITKKVNRKEIIIIGNGTDNMNHTYKFNLKAK